MMISEIYITKKKKSGYKSWYFQFFKVRVHHVLIHCTFSHTGRIAYRKNRNLPTAVSIGITNKRDPIWANIIIYFFTHTLHYTIVFGRWWLSLDAGPMHFTSAK